MLRVFLPFCLALPRDVFFLFSSRLFRKGSERFVCVLRNSPKFIRIHLKLTFRHIFLFFSSLYSFFKSIFTCPFLACRFALILRFFYFFFCRVAARHCIRWRTLSYVDINVFFLQLPEICVTLKASHHARLLRNGTFIVCRLRLRPACFLARCLRRCCLLVLRKTNV